MFNHPSGECIKSDSFVRDSRNLESIAVVVNQHPLRPIHINIFKKVFLCGHRKVEF